MSEARRTILLVDDEENILAALTRLLRRDGYQILRAGGGADGLDQLARHDVQIIVSDQRMPGMTGVEFLSRVKEQYPNTLRIVLSGYTELNSVTDAINRGAIYKFLTKPWDDELLRANVREAFEYHELRAENRRLTEHLRLANQELSELNRDLECRVEEKTRALRINLHALQISQDVLEHMPAAVLGVGSDGMIAVANRKAHDLLGQDAAGLPGTQIEMVLPAGIRAQCERSLANGTYQCFSDVVGEGTPVDVCCGHMGDPAGARGYIVVIGTRRACS